MTKKITIKNKTSLVTGANRGIGKAIASELVNRGAKKVYLGVRKLENAKELIDQFGDKVEAIQLDVSNANDLNALSTDVLNVDILINNAGILDAVSITGDNNKASILSNLEVNLFGVINLTNKILPQLKEKSEGAIATVGSVVSLANMPSISTYSISKAAVHSALQEYRALLAETPILVSGIYPGPIDTDMVRDFELEKASPEHVAKEVANGLEKGSEYIFPDPFAVEAGEAYSKNPMQLEKSFSGIQ